MPYAKREDYLALLARKRERYSADAEYRDRIKWQVLSKYYAKRGGAVDPDRRIGQRSTRRKERRQGPGQGECVLCGTSVPSLHRDHDHKVDPRKMPYSVPLADRGLLCPPCNHGLGSLKDDPALLRAAADYVERWDDTINDRLDAVAAHPTFKPLWK